ncbi:glycosyltransferase family 2 protein [Vibrio cyclitrophicus]
MIHFDLSIVIPCYNSENYILKCINSAIDELENVHVEYIFVNDGSTDRTAELIKNFVINDNTKFKLIEQDNKGVSSARNNGIKHCSGKYIMFLDSDDVVIPNFYGNLLKIIEGSEPDLIMGEYVTFNRLEDLSLVESEESKNYERDEFLTGYIYGDLVNNFSVCSSLYKRSFLNNNSLKFDESLAYAEDQYFLLKCIKLSSSINISNCKLIAYRQHIGSVTKSFNLKRLQTIDVFERLKGHFPLYESGLDLRINKELMSITMFHSRCNTFAKTIDFYKKEINPNIKNIPKGVDVNLQMFAFIHFGLLYPIGYKLLKWFR